MNCTALYGISQEGIACEITISITAESYRSVKARKLASRKKGRVRIVAFGSAGNPIEVVPNLGNQAVPNWEILQ